MSVRATLLFVPLVLAVWYVGQCALSWDDLPIYAEPKGFELVDHDWTCTGNGECLTFLDYGCDGYCYHDWLFVSNNKSFAEARMDLAPVYERRGWEVRECLYATNCFFAVLGQFEECFVYKDFQLDHRGRDGLYIHHRREIESARTALLVTTGCG